MIILYNFSHSHFAISCTGLKDCSFSFGFNSHFDGIQEIRNSPTDAPNGQYTLPHIIQPFFDTNHYLLAANSTPTRIGIPTVEDGNVYGPSELAIYNWLFFGDKSYATIVPVGPASLLDSIFHAPSKILRAARSRPIDTLYCPMGIGLFPLIDSAHCLDMIRWMLRVAFWDRDHIEDPRNLGHQLPPALNTKTPLNGPKSSMKANHLMRMCYWLASGPGFNTIGTPFGFNFSVNQLRESVISANHAAGYEVKEGIVIEAPGAGDYAKYFGKTYEEGGSDAPREQPMSPIYRWAVYQTWLRNIVHFNADGSPSNPLQYKRIKLGDTGPGEIPSDRLKTYFQHSYPDDLKFNMNVGEPDPTGQFYGRLYNHNAPPLKNWKELWSNKKTGSIITDRIRAVYADRYQRSRTLRYLSTGARELAKQDDFQAGIISCLPTYRDRTRENILGASVREKLANYFSKLLGTAYSGLGIPFSTMKTISGELLREIFQNPDLFGRLLDINYPNAGIILSHINASVYAKINSRIRVPL